MVPGGTPSTASLLIALALLSMPSGAFANGYGISIDSTQAQGLYYLDRSGFLLIELKVYGITEFEVDFDVRLRNLGPMDGYAYVSIVRPVKELYSKDFGSFVKKKYLLEVKMSVDGAKAVSGGCWSALIEVVAKLLLKDYKDYEEQTPLSVEDKDLVLVEVCSKDLLNEVLRTNYLSSLEGKVSSAIKALDEIDAVSRNLESRIISIDSVLDHILRNVSYVIQGVESMDSSIADVRELLSSSTERILGHLNLTASGLSDSVIKQLQGSLDRSREELCVAINQAEQKLSEELSGLLKIMLLALGVNIAAVATMTALLILSTIRYRRAVEEHDLLGL